VKLEGPARAFGSSNTSRLIPRAKRARASIDLDSSQTRAFTVSRDSDISFQTREGAGQKGKGPEGACNGRGW